MSLRGVALRHVPGLAIGLAAATLTGVILAPGEAAAMCGGNIFMTCPPSAKAATSATRTPSKSEARRRKSLLAPGRTK